MINAPVTCLMLNRLHKSLMVGRETSIQTSWIVFIKVDPVTWILEPTVSIEDWFIETNNPQFQITILWNDLAFCEKWFYERLHSLENRFSLKSYYVLSNEQLALWSKPMHNSTRSKITQKYSKYFEYFWVKLFWVWTQNSNLTWLKSSVYQNSKIGALFELFESSLIKMFN